MSEAKTKKRGTHPLTTNPQTASITYLVVQYLSTVGYPVGPREIASFHKLNPHSVRSRMSKMHARGLISRPSYGKYELTCRDELQASRGGIRAQNLVVVAEGVSVELPEGWVSWVDDPGVRGRAAEEVEISVELLTVRITFGAFRGKITYRVGVPLGLDPVGLVLVHYIVKREVEARGYQVPEEVWMVENVEGLEDFRGFRIEGMQGVTFWNLVGEMEKFYNRAGIRREVRLGSTKGVSLKEIRALMQEGVDMALVHRRMERIEQEMRRILEATKGSTRVAVETKRLNQALLDAFIRREDYRK